MAKSTKKLILILLSLTLSAMLFLTGASLILTANAQTSTRGNAQDWKEGKVKFEDRLWETPAAVRANGNASFDAKLSGTGLTGASFDTRGCTAYFIDGPTYNGQVTKIFCYVGIPSTASATNKVPAIVLVHGGGGTAYSEWVEFWVNNGYAAIAMDTEGMVPGNIAPGQSTAGTATPGAIDTDGNNSWHPYHHGPANACFQDVRSDVPIENQWFYQATGAVIASNSFIRSFEQVDATKVAITGISYGSYVTSLVCAYDSRYACATPVYGSLEQANEDTEFGMLIKQYPLAAELWDDGRVLSKTDIPFMFISGNKDTYFSAAATARNAKLMKNARVQYIDGFRHMHMFGALNVDSNLWPMYSFIDSYCRSGTPELVRVTGQPTAESATTYIKYPSSISIGSATLYYTTNEMLINNANSNGNYLDYASQKDITWSTVAATVSGTTITASIPAGTKYYYIEIQDSFGVWGTANVRRVCTDLVAIQQKPSWYYKLYNNDGSLFTWEQDPNGWGTRAYNMQLGALYKMNGAERVNINPWDYAGGYWDRYGLKANYYDKVQGISTLEFSGGGMVMNYKAFPVFEDIVFYYKYYDSGNAGEQGEYSISIFDNVESAMRTTDSTGLASVSNGAKYMFKGGNTGSNNGILKAQAVSEAEYTANSSNAADTWHKIKISIGDTSTKIWVDDVYRNEHTSLTRSSFQNGMAYFYLYQSNGVDFQFAFRESLDQIYYKGSTTGEAFADNKADENGWTTYLKDGTPWYDGFGNKVEEGGNNSSYAYGSAGIETIGDITKYKFDGDGYVVNHKQFMVNQDIYFEFNASTVADPVWEDGGDADFGSWYAFSLHSNFNYAFRASNITRANVMGDSTAMCLESSTSEKDHWSVKRNYNSLRISALNSSILTSKTLWANYSQSNWDNEFASVRISIGTNNTTVVINGDTANAMTFALKRSDFPQGYAYLGFGTLGAMEVNIKMTPSTPALAAWEADGNLVSGTDSNGFSTYLAGTYGNLTTWNGKILTNNYGRTDISVDSNGYSVLKLNTTGYIINNTALDVTKPIRLVYKVKASTTDNFYTFALFDNINTALVADNNTWNSDCGYKFNIRSANKNGTQWDADLPFNTLSISGGGGSIRTSGTIYPSDYSSTNWDKDIYIDIVIGDAATAIVVNGTTYEIAVKRSDFIRNRAYLSVATYSGDPLEMKMKVSQPTAAKYTQALTINEDIAITYSAEYPVADTQAVFTFNGTSTTVKAHAFINGKYFFKFGGITPQYLNSNITVALQTKTPDSSAYTTVDTQTISVRSYCDKLLSTYSSNAKLTKLVTDFLNYGAAAQKYTGVNAGSLANSGIDQSKGSTYSSLTAPQNIKAVTNGMKAAFTSARLELGSRVNVIVGFNLSTQAVADSTKVEFIVGGVLAETVAKANYTTASGTNAFEVKLENLCAVEFDNEIQILIKNSSDVVLAQATYSVNSYVASKVADASTSANELELLKALYCYGVSSKAYNG